MQESPGTQISSSATILDVRGLSAPDNILAILKSVGELPNGSTLEFLIESNPFQLYDLLQQRGFFLEIQPQEDGGFLGRLKARDDKDSSH
jgi:hypothetical protein